MKVKFVYESGCTEEFVGVVSCEFSRNWYSVTTKGLLSGRPRIHTSHSDGTDPILRAEVQ